MINLGQGNMGPAFTECSAKYKSKTGNSIKYYNIYIQMNTKMAIKKQGKRCHNSKN